jgi:DNA invertase Pin-like site-specific DNA recombinase
MIYGYARVSTDRQENSADAQAARLVAYCEQSGLPFGGLFVDQDQSAYRIPLNRRREGKKLCDALGPGDTLVFTKIDRCFRSLQDQCNTLAKWEAMGVTVVILDMPVQYADPFGRCTLSVIGASAQLASELTGQRIREVNAYLKQAGRPYSFARPYGWVVKDREYVAYEPERELGRRAMGMCDRGVRCEAIALAFAKEGVQKPRKRAGSSGYYNVADVYALVRSARAGYPKIPPRLSPADWNAEMQRAAVSDGSQPPSAASSRV